MGWAMIDVCVQTLKKAGAERMVGAATIRHRELQQQAKELRDLAAAYQAAEGELYEKLAARALRSFGERLGARRMAEVYDVATARFGTKAVRGVSHAWTCVYGWSA